MSDKTAIVVGASRGIGLGFAKHLVERGYKVIATERSRSDDLHAAADASDGAITIANCDVTDMASVKALGDRVEKGTLDLLVMNAGIMGERPQPLDALAHDNVADIVHTNATAPIQSALAILPQIKEGGTIAMLTSKMGSIDDSSGGANLYRVSKTAQNIFARSLFEEHAKDRSVGVLSLHPGWVQTDLGGPNALIDVDTSVSGMLDVIEGQSKAEHRFVAYDGSEIAW
ncbi:SDR family NAD(P)-dependent oxidoreductase [Aurantiacibacter sediminis]|uniref:SDR family NAD(P)-dependent oxidoreductase n=1 Tax=Aurantiacibacter sediminis TaxID=2793064 RepID=A0ABS0N0T9_9SPHN|nr:SDR family NAD(P)-dependent oxidoreductase [Aurantiacibacter sediminis]MBH5321587.1 SDR family NAD(P)-dependent oxidoreductase [Aurantiacibacter sediminis]